MDWQTLSAVTRFRFIFKDGSFFLFSRFWTPYDIILIHNSSSEVLYTLPGKNMSEKSEEIFESYENFVRSKRLVDENKFQKKI